MTYTYKAGNVIPQHDRPCIPATTVILEVVITLRNLFAGKLTVSTLHLEPPFFSFFVFFLLPRLACEAVIAILQWRQA